MSEKLQLQDVSDRVSDKVSGKIVAELRYFSGADELVIERLGEAAALLREIVHQLRNPCTIIGGFAALLNRRLDPADKLSEYAETILDETLKMERFLDYFLTCAENVSTAGQSMSDKQLSLDFPEMEQPNA
jgi:signal transduction histidine kinase